VRECLDVSKSSTVSKRKEKERRTRKDNPRIECNSSHQEVSEAVHLFEFSFFHLKTAGLVGV